MNKQVRRKSNRKHSSGYLSGKAAYFGDKDVPVSIELIQYDPSQAEIKPIALECIPTLNNYIAAGKVNWFRVTGISDASVISQLCRKFGLHIFDAKDLLSDQQVVKMVTYDKATYALLSYFYQDKTTGTLDDIQIGFILGKDFVVSFQEEVCPIFDEAKDGIKEKNGVIRQKGADYLLYVLLNAVNYANMNTVMDIEDRMAELETRLIEGQGRIDTLSFLHGCRVSYTHIKRSVVSLREEFNNLLHNTNKLVADENIIYFNDFDDRMRATLGDLESLHESLVSLLDLYYNNNNLKMNEIIKRLTIVSTLFIPLTFMVGVWGMNFKFMPEMDWKYGYLVSWIILAVIALATYLWMRRQKWF
ncbi:magnesium/cobalt transporter CorA [Dysgonomonas sp. 511]|uniref:magnesium/cobalt transporter CorA n=1 Tax=Dysgonomonas sp. 511 TaxID=2302930 RepID=UPI0013D4E77A|nr:magnesium/cobalt transporter CorA [Dysgonomonas sp. 511]NDV77502.1 magnesium and cobalt transport protein CorA [Dysgonomonas sp. 511]